MMFPQKLENFFCNRGFEKQLQYNEERTSYLLHPYLFFNSDSKKYPSVYYFDWLINRRELKYGPQNHDLIARESFTAITNFLNFKSSPCTFYKQALLTMDTINDGNNISFVPTDLSQSAIGIQGYGWEVTLDGRYIGEIVIVEKLAGKQVKEKAVFHFDLTAICVVKKNKSIQIDQELPMYLHNHSSKDVLYDLFDIYMSEATYALRNQLNYTAFNFLVKSILVYEFLVIRGTLSITEKIGYNKKFTELLQTCIQE
ncbi:glycine--tRNA ligase subunit alpha [Proteinivorax tanatarense]|uniref:Glycine--tRNA ligase subunit alpha n=1 Tax=Proteinivorax tanatarense TaxID=1260629 RepID=A0AAU7VI35_9FIRM